MLQCEECEYFTRDEGSGRITLRCDPFRTVKEPSCLAKWQLLRLDALLGAYHAQLQWYQKLAPMQEKMFEMMQREIEDIDESDSWKYQYDDEEEPGPDDGEEPEEKSP
ncbi:MAG: hypothetical protein JW810_11660 [Sedimentisphaerales bacterium]|nr:hypothetical protein [Sedimentisphaerales bacterium]